jgi:hypothetical protein
VLPQPLVPRMGTLAGERKGGRVPILTRGHTLWYSFYICTLCAHALFLSFLDTRQADETLGVTVTHTLSHQYTQGDEDSSESEGRAELVTRTKCVTFLYYYLYGNSFFAYEAYFYMIF